MDNKRANSTQTTTLPHEISMKNRTDLKISGVLEVISATNLNVSLKTSTGGLLISGENLKILNLNNQDKTLDVQGVVNELKYDQKKKKILEKLFK